MHTDAAPPTAPTPGVRPHVMGAAPPVNRLAEDVPEERVVVTPVDMEERAAAAHGMTFHPTSELAGARLDPQDPRAPFGATAKDAAGEPMALQEGQQDDPYGMAGGRGAVATGGGMDELAALGDGTLAGAEAAIEGVREGGA